MALLDHLNKAGYFKTIVEEKSLSKASLKLRISQPQLSRILFILEDELQCRLLIRTPKGVKPTHEGQILYKLFSEIIEKINTEEQIIMKRSISEEVLIRFGAYDSIATYLLPSFFNYLSQISPKVKFNLVTGRSQSIIEKVNAAEIDVGIIITAEAKNERNYVLVYADHFAAYQSVRLSNHFLDKLIVFEGAFSVNDLIEYKKFLRINKIQTLVQTNNFETTKALVEEGMGVGILPHLVAKKDLRAGKIELFDSKSARTSFNKKHYVYMIFNDKLFPSREFIEREFLAHFANWL